MNTHGRAKPFTVLVGVDYSELSAHALVESIEAARSHEKAHVHVVHVAQLVSTVGPNSDNPFPITDGAPMEASEVLQKYVETVLADAREKWGTDGKPLVDRLTTHIRFANPARTIAQLASDVEADLVVVGTHGRRGVAHLLLGSVAEGVVRRAPCAVLVVRPPETVASDIPEIEPPCTQCVETRKATGGAEFWCAQHTEHHGRRHTYHVASVSSGHQSGFLFPLSS